MAADGGEPCASYRSRRRLRGRRPHPVRQGGPQGHNLDFEPEVIIASFHGMPLDTRTKGDPYHDQCHRTADLVWLRLGLPPDRLIVTFQSRFGKGEWLRPYTDGTIKTLAARGIKRLVVITPGFSADCLETIEEIGSENAGYFFAGGGDPSLGSIASTTATAVCASSKPSCAAS